MSSEESSQELNREFVAAVERLKFVFQKEGQLLLRKKSRPTAAALNALFARMREPVRKNLKAVAKAQRHFSPSPFDDPIHERIVNAARDITAPESERRIPDWLVSFTDRLQQLLIQEWEFLKSTTEVEEPDLVPLLPKSVVQQIMNGLMALHRSERRSIADREPSHHSTAREQKSHRASDPIATALPLVDDSAWQIELGKKIHTWYTEMRRVEKLYPAGAKESTLSREHPEFKFLEEVIKKLVSTEQTDFFARMHKLSAAERYDFIGSALGKSRHSVMGYVKMFRKSLKVLAK